MLESSIPCFLYFLNDRFSYLIFTSFLYPALWHPQDVTNLLTIPISEGLLSDHPLLPHTPTIAAGAFY